MIHQGQTIRLTSKIGLDTRNRHHDLVLVLVCNLLATPAEVVVGAELKHVRGKVVTLENQVLDDSIHHRILVFDTWDGNVAHVLEEGWDDDL